MLHKIKAKHIVTTVEGAWNWSGEWSMGNAWSYCRFSHWRTDGKGYSGSVCSVYALSWAQLCISICFMLSKFMKNRLMSIFVICGSWLDTLVP